MYAERNGQEIEIGMSVAEWSAILAAIHHSKAFDAKSVEKYSALIQFKEAVQVAAWREDGAQVHTELYAAHAAI